MSGLLKKSGLLLFLWEGVQQVATKWIFDKSSAKYYFTNFLNSTTNGFYLQADTNNSYNS